MNAGCCGRKGWPTEKQASRLLAKVQSLGLSDPMPAGLERCGRGMWHFRLPAKDTGPSNKLRVLVEIRDGNRCVRCGRPVTRNEDSHHHRLPRGRGGENTAENLLILCGDGVTFCHGWVEKNRAAAYKLGYLVPSGIDPADVPVAVAGVGWRWPTGDGRWITAEEYGTAGPDLAVTP